VFLKPACSRNKEDIGDKKNFIIINRRYKKNGEHILSKIKNYYTKHIFACDNDIFYVISEFRYLYGIYMLFFGPTLPK
jgi:hypothetical protein